MKLTHIFAKYKKLDDVLSQRIKTIPLEALPIQWPTQCLYSINILWISPLSIKHLHTVFYKVWWWPIYKINLIYIPHHYFQKHSIVCSTLDSSLTPLCLEVFLPVYLGNFYLFSNFCLVAVSFVKPALTSFFSGLPRPKNTSLTALITSCWISFFFVSTSIL